MGWAYYIKTKESEINIEDIQEIINKFQSNWFHLGEDKRNEKPIKQDWGWSTIVDICNPWIFWEDDKFHQKICILPISGCYGTQNNGKIVTDFVVEQLEKLNYTILDIEFSC